MGGVVWCGVVWLEGKQGFVMLLLVSTFQLSNWVICVCQLGMSDVELKRMRHYLDKRGHRLRHFLSSADLDKYDCHRPVAQTMLCLCDFFEICCWNQWSSRRVNALMLPCI